MIARNLWQRLAVAVALLGVETAAEAQQPKLMAVDWSDPEIASYVRDRATNPPRSLTPEDEAKLAGLRLPVLAFDRPPDTVERAFGVAAIPPRQRKVVTDPNQPVWYHIVDAYADITITVDADLRVQQELPASTQVFTPPSSAKAEPRVNIIDEKTEGGMEGLIAEYSVLKFGNIPYRITVECTTAKRNVCRDPQALLKDRDSLRIISARPPK